MLNRFFISKNPRTCCRFFVIPWTHQTKSLQDEMSDMLDDSWGFGSFRIIKLQYRRTARLVTWLDDSGSSFAALQPTRLNTAGSKLRLKAATQTLLLNRCNAASFGHPYHLVNPSMLPLAMSAAFFTFFSYLLAKLRMGVLFGEYFEIYAHLSLVCIPMVIGAWMVEISREETRGAHTLEVQTGFRIAILLFIASEFMLFASFFWAFFHSALNPSVMTGGYLLPVGIAPVFFERIPLLNTHQLIISGCTLTFAHTWLLLRDRETRLQQWMGFMCTSIFFIRHRRVDRANISSRFTSHSYVRGFIRRRWTSAAPRIRVSHMSNMDAITKYTTINAWDMRRVVLNKPRKLGWVARRSTNLPVLWVMDTVVRGAVFLALQVFEYATADFRITDSIFGGLLYSLTGLHGFHVLVGLICLGCFVSYSLSQFVPLKLYWRIRRRRVAAHYTTSYKFRWWTHRVAFEGAVWYWHFVDVVWIAVFVVVYVYPYRTNTLNVVLF